MYRVGDRVHLGERRLVLELGVLLRPRIPWNRKKAIPRLPDTSRSNGMPSAFSSRIAADRLAEDAAVVPAAQPAVGGDDQQQRLLDSAALRAAGGVTSPAFWLRSAAISAILRVYASASVARSSAFLNRAVAISSIVLRDLPDVPDRLAAFHEGTEVGHGFSCQLVERRRSGPLRSPVTGLAAMTRRPTYDLRLELRLERRDRGVQLLHHLVGHLLFLASSARTSRLLFLHELEELLLPRPHLLRRSTLSSARCCRRR